MDLLTGFGALLALTCLCLIVLALFEDNSALFLAAMLQARVEGRRAYREAYRQTMERVRPRKDSSLDYTGI